MTQTINAAGSAPTDLQRFAALAVGDAALTQALDAAEEPGRFAELALQNAAARGLALDAAALRAAVEPDPLGLARWSAPPVEGASWPPRQWLPIQVAGGDGQIFVDWAYFGARPLTEPFFEESIRRALRRPFNRFIRYRMSLRDFLDHAETADSLAPTGFIFHMSRCGSTLAAQMLAARADHIVASEAAPVDAVLQLRRAWPDLPADRPVRALAAMVAAFGRRRAGDERYFVIKLDCWHTLALSSFTRAFPSVPWVFLYRDPVEVLVSQMRQRGTQMVPQFVPPSLYGIDTFDGVPDEEYCARVLGKICGAVVDRFSQGGGLAVNYRDLPEALFTRILPHFGVSCSEGDRAAMRLVARQDAKAPSFAFSADSEAKQRAATDRLRALAERHLGDIYRALEALSAL